MSNPLDRLAEALKDRYTPERELGAGGMATVFLAQDLRHHRQVAVKVLRPELSALLGTERFLKEIELTAGLQHPHILPLFDSGEAAGHLYYVMPYVAGESLRDRLVREKQLPVELAVRIASQVAGALDYAHRRSVIHRDIKPENILLHDGQALVADFGIALAVRQAGGNRLTETGLSLGTPQYMSPEQATGERTLDARSDVYSLGCVLYEMLVGEPPHTGPTVQAVLARVVAEEPRPITDQRRAVPPHVEAAVLQALEKLPADRFAAAAEFAQALATPGSGSTATSRSRHATRPDGWRRAALWAGLLGIGTVAGLTVAWITSRAAPVPEEPVRRTSILLPDSVPLAMVGEARFGIGRRSLALSPDGRTLVYAGRYGNRTHLFVRPLDDDRIRRLEGTEGAYGPFFSPDGRWVGFFAQTTLMKVPLDGGAPVELADAPDTYGAAWLDDGRILFAKDEGATPMSVSENGGTASPAGLVFTDSPTPLGDGKHILSASGIRLRISSLTDSTILLWRPTGFAPPSPTGGAVGPGASPQLLGADHVIVAGDGRLYAMPFSARRLEASGAMVPLDEHVRQENFGTAAQFAIGGGTLVHVPGSDVAQGVLVMADRRGSVDTLPFERAHYREIGLSADGRRVAWTVRVARGFELWMLDLDARTRTVLRTEPTVLLEPHWSADGRSIIYLPQADEILQVPTSGGLPRRWDHPGAALIGMSRDGSLRAVLDSAGRPQLDGAGATRVPVPRDGAVLVDFSRDNRWMLWMDVGVRHYEIFVSALPLGGPVFSVTPDGCGEAYWMPDGREIVCLGFDGHLYSVPLRFVDQEVRGGTPRRLTRHPILDTPGRSFALTPDGQHMIYKVASPAGDSARVLTVVTNFRRVVERKVAEAQGQGRQ